MAERRMFAKTIIDSDFFLDMPMSARLLYYDLGMRADDDGFVNSPKKIIKMCGNADNDLSILVAKKFIILFQTGIIVIKHWKLNNYLRADRYRETSYLNEKSQLEIKENGSYKAIDSAVITCLPDGIPVVDAGKVSIGKLSKGKDSINTSSETLQTSIKPKPTEDKITKPKDNTFKNKIEEYTDNENLRNTLNEFVLMRKTMKPGLTDYALKLLFTKLDKLSNGLDDLKIKILEQSIMSSYKGIFPIECGKNGKLNTVPKEPQTIQELMRGINKSGG